MRIRGRFSTIDPGTHCLIHPCGISIPCPPYSSISMVSVAAESRVKAREEETRDAIPQLNFSGSVRTCLHRLLTCLHRLLSCLHRLLTRLIYTSSPKQTLQFSPGPSCKTALAYNCSPLQPPSVHLRPKNITCPGSAKPAKRAQRFLLFFLQ